MQIYIQVNITRDDELLECTAEVEYHEGVQHVEPLVEHESGSYLLSCTETERILKMEVDDAGSSLDHLYFEALQEITAESFCEPDGVVY